MISAPISRVDLQKQTEADNIQAAWSLFSHYPSRDELKAAAQLAQDDYLSSVKNMWIEDKDLSEIPNDNIGKLSSIVTDSVTIYNITPLSQLGTILASVQSEELWLGNVVLSEENTRALVTAMSRVKYVTLNSNVTLDPELLSAYDGQGHCTKLWVYGDTSRSYGDRLKRWAADRGWTVTEDNSVRLVMQRQ